MMASDFSMRAKWRALKSGWRSAPQKVLDRGNIVRDGRKVAYARKCKLVSTPEIPASGRSQRKNRYVTAHVLQEDFNEATIAADAFACRRRPVWRELL